MIVDDILLPLCAKRRASVLCISLKAKMILNKLKSLMENSKFVLTGFQKKRKKMNFSLFLAHIFESENEVAWLCPTLCGPMDFSLPGSSVHGILQARILKQVAVSFSRESSQSMGWTQVSHIAGRLFIIEPRGKPQSGMGSLRQGICLTQGSNSGLLHCRQILYHLNHQGSPTYL